MYFCYMEKLKPKEGYVIAQKNGIEGYLHQTTWTRIGGHENKDGWVLVPSDPAEVLAIREKKTNPAQGIPSQEENVIAVKNDHFNPEGEIKQLKEEKPKKEKPAKKVK